MAVKSNLDEVFGAVTDLGTYLQGLNQAQSAETVPDDYEDLWFGDPAGGALGPPDAATIEDMDEYAVEKAIYQTGMGSKQGIDPSGMLTPYGPGLTTEEIDAMIDKYKGIPGSGIDWPDPGMYFDEAQKLVEAMGDSIERIMDGAWEKLADVGQLEGLEDVLGAVGTQLGDAALSGLDRLLGATATPVEALGRDPETGGALKPPEDKALFPWLEGVADKIGDWWADQIFEPIGQEHFDEWLQDPTAEEAPPLGFPGWPEGPGRAFSIYLDENPEILEIFRSSAGYPASPENIIEQLQGLIDDGTLTDEEVEGVLDDPRLRALLGGPPPPTTRMRGSWDQEWLGGMTIPTSQLHQSFQQDLDAALDKIREGFAVSVLDGQDSQLTDPMTAAAVAGAIPSGDGDGVTDPLGRDASYPFTEPLGTDLDPYWDLVQQEEQPKRPVAGTLGLTAQTRVATQTGKPVADPTAAIAFADDAGEKLGADEALQTRFYQIAYAMPGAGRADVRARLDDVFSQTRALFFLHRGEDAWNIINVAQGQGGDERKNTLNTLADNYDTFLRGDDGYFKNPARYRYGPDFQKRLGDVSRILLKLETEPQVELWANDFERKQGLFVEGLFGGESSYNKSNRSSLITMNLTKGSRGYFSDQIHRAVQRMTTYYKRIGKTDAETFAIMGRITSATPPDPGATVAPAPIPIAPDPQSPFGEYGPDPMGQFPYGDTEELMLGEGPPTQIREVPPFIEESDDLMNIFPYRDE